MFLTMLLTGCVVRSGVVKTAVRCEHPVVHPQTLGGLVKGISDYYDQVEICNALNGYKPIPHETYGAGR